IEYHNRLKEIESRLKPLRELRAALMAEKTVLE
ncbi:unnamed protein product, partial [marine sediment metagenome]